MRDRISRKERGGAPDAAVRPGRLLFWTVLLAFLAAGAGSALADPVYSLPHAYEGKWGWSWLYRTPPVSKDSFLDEEWKRLFPADD